MARKGVPRGRRHPTSQRGASDESNLTDREREILACFARGMSSTAIAKRLSISRATVRNHGQRILQKLGVHNRIAAVSRAYARGLIPLPGPNE
jgi:DNA-binding CsgD family transcriptional regulator